MSSRINNAADGSRGTDRDLAITAAARDEPVKSLRRAGAGRESRQSCLTPIGVWDDERIDCLDSSPDSEPCQRVDRFVSGVEIGGLYHSGWALILMLKRNRLLGSKAALTRWSLVKVAGSKALTASAGWPSGFAVKL